MKVIETNVYEYDELSDSAKEKAREWYKRNNDDNYWSEWIIEEAAAQGELLGITFKEQAKESRSGKPLPSKPCIYWSGFWCQGDGACFEGSWSARDCLAGAGKVADGWGESTQKRELLRIATEFFQLATKFPNASFTVKHSGHYQHENCTEFDFAFPREDGSDEWPEGEEDRYSEACDDIKKTAKDFMRWIYRHLEDGYNAENADDNIAENIRANEYTFTEEGKRFGE